MQPANDTAELEHNHIVRENLEANPVPVSHFARHGRVVVNHQETDLYLARNPPYTSVSSQREAWADTSALLLIDQNHDGRISQDECRNVSLPVRIGDSMYTVQHIASNGSEITFVPSGMPLQSMAVGRRCPAFAYQSLSGKSVSLQSMKGKAFLIDIWSFT